MDQLNRIDYSALKKFEFHTQKVHVIGGLLKNPQPVTMKEVPTGKLDENGAEVQHMYVRMSTADHWMMLATTGNRRASDCFGPRSLLKRLRELSMLACDGELPVNEPRETQREADPMDEINVMETPRKKIRCDGKRRKRYYDNRASHKILALSMPCSPPELMEKGNEERIIRLWIGDRKSLWLHHDDVEWAVRYMWVQFLLKGVPLVPSASEGPGEMQPLPHSASQGSPSRDGVASPASPVSSAEEIDLAEDVSPGEPVRLSRARSDDFSGTDLDSQDPYGADSQILLF